MYISAHFFPSLPAINVAIIVIRHYVPETSLSVFYVLMNLIFIITLVQNLLPILRCKGRENLKEKQSHLYRQDKHFSIVSTQGSYKENFILVPKHFDCVEFLKA